MGLGRGTGADVGLGAGDGLGDGSDGRGVTDGAGNADALGGAEPRADDAGGTVAPAAPDGCGLILGLSDGAALPGDDSPPVGPGSPVAGRNGPAGTSANGSVVSGVRSLSEATTAARVTIATRAAAPALARRDRATRARRGSSSRRIFSRSTSAAGARVGSPRANSTAEP